MQSHEDIVNAVFFVSVTCVGFIDAVSGFRNVFICTGDLKTAHHLISYDIFKMQYIILPVASDGRGTDFRKIHLRDVFVMCKCQPYTGL